jgi:DNA-binding beta-propeller fold protein YncE
MTRRILSCFAIPVCLLAASSSARAQDEIFVTNSNSNSVTVYAGGANGNVAPLRILSGNATGLSSPSGIAVDRVNNEIVVVNKTSPYSVTVYPRRANGNVSPLRTITGALTNLSDPRGVAVDPVNNELAVANRAGFSVTVFGRTANGNIAPLRSLVTTGFSNPWGVLIDIANNEIAVANNGDLLSVYPRTGNGNVPPLRTISGSNTGFNNGPIGIVLDPMFDTYFVTNPFFGANFDPVVLEFDRTAAGNVNPVRVYGGVFSGMSSPNGIALDPDRREFLVANSVGNSITIYDRFTSGSVTPLRTLGGANTLLSNPQVVAMTYGLFADGFDP